jgi:pimeloyl-ACP methyl ester carboxylesterase
MRGGSSLNRLSSSPSLAESLHRATAHGADVRYLRLGSGKPIVLLHTLRTQLDYFGPLLQQIDTRQAEVIAIDLPGHGESSAPRVDYTADYFTNVVEALLEVCDLRDALVVGESIGGSIALALAARHIPRLSRVVALNPYDYGRWDGIRRSSPLATLRRLARTRARLPLALPAVAKLDRSSNTLRGNQPAGHAHLRQRRLVTTGRARSERPGRPRRSHHDPREQRPLLLPGKAARDRRANQRATVRQQANPD